MRAERGREEVERRDFSWKRLAEERMSARRAARKVRVVSARPIIVRYWKCQPYDVLLGDLSDDEHGIYFEKVGYQEYPSGLWTRSDHGNMNSSNLHWIWMLYQTVDGQCPFHSI